MDQKYRRKSITSLLGEMGFAYMREPAQFYSHQVKNFHENILRTSLPLNPRLPVEKENSVRMLKEEFKELMAALGQPVLIVDLPAETPDLVEVADGAGDLIYVCYGLLLKCGIFPEAILDEIAISNNEKVWDPTDPTKPVRKPEGWQPPRLKQILVAMGWIP